MQGAACFIALGAMVASAQEPQTVEIEGTVNSWFYYSYSNTPQGPTLQSAETFKFVVE